MTIQRPFPAYRGPDTHIFVCYAHADAEIVYPEIESLHEERERMREEMSRMAVERWCPDAVDKLPSPALPFFQMTSIHTDYELDAAYTDYRSDEILADLIGHTGLDPTDPLGIKGWLDEMATEGKTIVDVGSLFKS